MRSLLAAFVTALIVSALGTPVVRRFAIRVGAVSTPGGRHVHSSAVPRLGGLAIFAALFAPLAAMYVVDTAVSRAVHGDLPRAAGLFAGGLLMCSVGVVDDTRGMRAIHKLYAQIGAAVLAFCFGFRIDAVSLPLIGELSMGIFALPVTVLWIVGIINAVNLIDGLDGLAAGVVFFAGITNFVVAYLAGPPFVALVMASMLGAVLGFLFYNFNPARIFMGDSGSYFLGYVLATMSLIGAVQKASTAVSLLVPVLALGVPIVDTLFALVRRFLERRPLFAPDRAHIHHRLLAAGITHRRAVLIIYAICIVFTVAAMSIALGHSWEAGIALVAASVVLVGLVRFVGYFEYLHIVRRQKARVRGRDSELLRYAVPTLPGKMNDARNEDDVWQTLTQFMVETDLAFFELIEVDDGKERVVFQCKNPTHTGRTERDVVTSRYPLGRDSDSRADIKFAWVSDFGDVAPQSDILLQVAADVVAARLTRTGSRFAPMAAPEEQSVLSDAWNEQLNALTK